MMWMADNDGEESVKVIWNEYPMKIHGQSFFWLALNLEVNLELEAKRISGLELCSKLYFSLI